MDKMEGSQNSKIKITKCNVLRAIFINLRIMAVEAVDVLSNEFDKATSKSLTKDEWSQEQQAHWRDACDKERANKFVRDHILPAQFMKEKKTVERVGEKMQNHAAGFHKVLYRKIKMVAKTGKLCMKKRLEDFYITAKKIRAFDTNKSGPTYFESHFIAKGKDDGKYVKLIHLDGPASSDFMQTGIHGNKKFRITGKELCYVGPVGHNSTQTLELLNIEKINENWKLTSENENISENMDRALDSCWEDMSH
ncbi:uncharacterized protein LOC111713687 isoform X2 [Eurytemora carolleeae]|uniref:uncharacterized protein LOC111713687 isoform X2 n=1 Tax=Eurytemora carolleeae TaxID=1294199 RepID=UPI000C78DE2B|nr:uncharacterized protein LOC111713687 isoform X2 [Eurytemora carolleeae]|eukprot:XP_023344388.1 uncharacterized protein LOC111713687 isoform X2 [Eurytemora affinis]